MALALIGDQHLAECALNVRKAHGAAIKAHVVTVILLALLAVAARSTRPARVDRHTVARTYALHLAANGIHDAGHLMSQHHRLADPDRSESTVMVIVQIRSADAASLDPDVDLVRAGLLFLAVLDAQIFRCMNDDGAHWPYLRSGEKQRVDRLHPAPLRQIISVSPYQEQEKPMGLDRFSLKGRCALVTGSSQGIGNGLSKGLAAAGATVVLNGRDEAKLEKAVQDLRAAGHTVHARAFDVSDSKAASAGVDTIEREIGPIDILVNNAGMTRRMPTEDLPDEIWHEIIRTNLDSVFYMSRAVGLHMIGRKRGSIINICSVMSELGRPTIVPYTASKGGVKMMTKGLAADWGKHGIRVNGIGPGYFKTPLNEALIKDQTFSAWVASRTPLGRWGDVDELVGAAVFLASDAASFVTGHIVYVDGGITSVV